MPYGGASCYACPSPTYRGGVDIALFFSDLRIRDIKLELELCLSLFPLSHRPLVAVDDVDAGGSDAVKARAGEGVDAGA